MIMSPLILRLRLTNQYGKYLLINKQTKKNHELMKARKIHISKHFTGFCGQKRKTNKYKKI